MITLRIYYFQPIDGNQSKLLIITICKVLMQVKRQKIRDTLNSGITIICDRYYLSGIVYTLAKGNPLISLTWAMSPDVGLPKPDICFFLDVSEEVAAQRGDGYGDEIYENEKHQRQVRAQFYRCCDYGRYNDWVKRVNASMSIEDVEKTLLTLSLEAFEKFGNQKLESVEELPFDREVPVRAKRVADERQAAEEASYMAEHEDSEADEDEV